ncbi:MAG TPA: DUF2849 domain-containing protein [Rhizomicrobium sp.]|nr:DUF2849 domain-containing protein [Rhizomicrobium sp.]
MAAPALQVLTANRLRDGAVVYGRAGAWVETFEMAEVFEAKETADAALAGAGEDVKARLVVNPYLFAVRRDGETVRAVEEREIVRSEGPSVRRDLGKQAGGKDAGHGRAGATPGADTGAVMESFDVSL